MRLGRRYNEWMYRVRATVFDRVLDELGFPESERAVADVGVGTGFYVDRWLARGAKVTGIDLTEVAVENLRQRYPSSRFIQADIGADLPAELTREAGGFDAVSAFDVLFHITDDAAYTRAFVNIATLLKPGGLFLWSDNFLHQPSVRVSHQVSRSLEESRAALAQAGLEVVQRVPMFVLMNYPADTRSRLARWAWTAMAAPAMASEALGWALGAVLYPIERALVKVVRESPSTELMVCRKRTAG